MLTKTLLKSVIFFTLSIQCFAESVTVISELSIKPDKITPFLDWVNADLEKSRSFNGNLQFDIYVQAHQSTKVLFIEQWESLEHQGEYMQWRQQRGDFAQMQGFLNAAPVTRILQSAANNHGQ